MWSLLLGAALARPFVTHEATRTETGLHWTAEVTGADGPLTLATPLETAPRVSAGVVLLRDDAGRVVGFDPPSGRFAIALDQPAVDGDVVLEPPLVAGALQRVNLAHARFDPDPAAGLALKIGHWETADVDRRDRRALEKALGRDRGGAMWIGPAGLTGPLAGELSPPGARPMVVASAAGLLAVVLGLLAVGVRALEGAVRRERNEAYIRTELTGRL